MCSVQNWRNLFIFDETTKGWFMVTQNIIEMIRAGDSVFL